MRGHFSVLCGRLFPGNEPGAENGQVAVLVRLSILFCYVFGTPIEMNRGSRACASTYTFSVVGSFPSPNRKLGDGNTPFKYNNIGTVLVAAHNTQVCVLSGARVSAEMLQVRSRALSILPVKT